MLQRRELDLGGRGSRVCLRPHRSARRTEHGARFGVSDRSELCATGAATDHSAETTDDFASGAACVDNYDTRFDNNNNDDGNDGNS